MIIRDFGEYRGSTGYADLPGINTFVNDTGAQNFLDKQCGGLTAYANAQGISAAIAALPNEPEAQVVKAAEAAANQHLQTRLTDFQWNWAHGGVPGALFARADRVAASKAAASDVCDIVNNQYPALSAQAQKASDTIAARKQAAADAITAQAKAQSAQATVQTSASVLEIAKTDLNIATAEDELKKATEWKIPGTQIPVAILFPIALAGGGFWLWKRHKKAPKLAGYRRRGRR